MAKKYIKKVEVVNKTYFKKLGLNPADMGLSQRRYTDRLITLVKPCSNKLLRAGVQQLILDFVSLTKDMDRHGVKNAYTSVIKQIEHSYDSQDPTVEWKFDISEYEYCEILNKLRGED